MPPTPYFTPGPTLNPYTPYKNPPSRSQQMLHPRRPLPDRLFAARWVTRVWGLGSESEFRHQEPNPEMGLGQSLESSFGSGFGPGFGSEFRARSKFGSLGQGLGFARVEGSTLSSDVMFAPPPPPRGVRTLGSGRFQKPMLL